MIIRETCQVIWTVFQPSEMAPPNKEKWLSISERFYATTNFPLCLGSIDGKHIRCKNPQNGGSYFFNYKKYFSIILMAVVDANLSFISIDVGAYGREADSNVFKESPFGKMLYNNQLDIPEPTFLPNTFCSPQPYVFVADEAFALHKNLLRPYPGRGLTDKRRIFNYRLSRARRTVECAFGVLSNKWRVLHTPLLVEPEFADDIVKACCILHNFVRKRDGCNFEDMDTSFLVDDLPARGTGTRSEGVEVRDNYADYFMTPEGSVPFQYNHI